MDRRRLLAGAALVGISRLLPAQNCAMVAPGVALCSANISFPQVALAAEIQQCPEWCWAASISAVFNFFGYSVDQRTIVMRKYHQLVCAPSQTAAQIAAFLNTQWTDESTGNQFACRLTAAFDAMAHVGAINNAIIVNELLNQRPVMYCNLSHAMVIVGVTYFPTPIPNIQSVTVMDPWPYSPRLHPLSAPEMVPAVFNPLGQYVGGGQMSFLASVTVS
ncbi:MAG: C39 family peptidase [Terracidiphilus sp.]